MSSRVKTGDVFQIRRNGRNYVSLGKVVDNEGSEYVAATLNGNISYSGEMKSPHLVGRQRRKAKIHVIAGTKIQRVNGFRTVNLESVTRIQGDGVANHLVRTTTRNGVETDAPNILTQIRDITSSL